MRASKVFTSGSVSGVPNVLPHQGVVEVLAVTQGDRTRRRMPRGGWKDQLGASPPPSLWLRRHTVTSMGVVTDRYGLVR
jgi:hypothetical protein